MKYILLLILSSCYFVNHSFAYESMIRHGYANCMSCHQSATGAGLLTSYGKVMAAQISTFNSNLSKELSSINQALQARMAHLETNGEARNFPMQFDYLTSFTYKKLQASLTLAKAPNSTDPAQKKTLKQQLYFRKALLRYQHNPSLIFEFGRDYLEQGLNLIDHSYLIRQNNKHGVTDFFTMARSHIYINNFKLSPYIFIPSFQESNGNSEKGLGIKIDKYFTSNKLVIGTSLLNGKTQFIKRNIIDLYFKKAFSPFLIMGQASFTQRETLPQKTQFDQEVFLLSTSYFPIDSVEIKTSIEKMFIATPFNSKVSRFGYFLSWKPWRYISLQYDAKRNIHTQGNFQSIYQIYFNGWFL